MVTNALVPAGPYAVEYQLVPQDYLVGTVKHYPEEIILSRMSPGEHTFSEQQSGVLPFTAREAFQQRTSFSGDFLSGFTSRWSSPGQKPSSPCSDDHTHATTYGSDACLMSGPIDKGTYVDFYF